MTVVHPRSLAAAVRRMTKANPLVMCVTNRVTAQRVADLTLAAGASPAMIDNPAEVPGFAAISSAVYINAGLHTSQVAALEALKSMSARPKLVLDPVGFGASAYRNQAIQDFLVRSPPNVIKGNSNEICGLVGADASGQGVDSAAGTAGAIEPAIALSRRHGQCVVCVTGDHDVVVQARDGEADLVCRIVGDTPMMAKVTGTGCALGAVVAAFVASAPAGNGRLAEAVVAAHAMYTAAALHAIAAEGTHGPGTLSVAFADALHTAACEPAALLAAPRVELLSGGLPDADGQG